MRYLLLGLCLFGLAHFCHQKTDRFALYKIQSSLEPRPDWDTETPPLPSALNQPFFYLDHGVQSYAFVSKDGEFVLKFYRHSRTSHPLAWMKGALPKRWKQRLEQTLAKRQAKRIKDFHSFKLASDCLKEETALLWVHLNTDPKEHIPLTLYDKIGVKQQVDLSQMTFLLQRRVYPFYPTLEQWIEEKESAKAKEALTSLVQLLKSRCQKGLFDKDPDLKTNFGLLGTRVVQIDVGRFRHEESLKNLRVMQEDVLRITDPLKQWLVSKAPELADHLHYEVYR